MIEKPIDKIAKEDIESLVNTRKSERKTLDYKLQLPPSQPPEAKREFLYDVSSFANADGGDIVFGIADERDSAGKPTGMPASAEGLALENLSSEILRMENSVRDGIDPRIAGIEWQPIAGFSAGPVLVMRIPRSWIGPHMVTSGGVSRFYSRNSAGKYPLNVGEIRSAFLASSAIGESLRRFRFERIAKAIENDLPLSLGEGGKILLHLIPLSALDSTTVRDVVTGNRDLQLRMEPMSGPGGWSRRYNFDGLLTFPSGVASYVQLFRSGVIEAAEGDFFKWTQDEKSIPTSALEDAILKAVGRYLRLQKELGISLPIAVLLTLIGVKGFMLNVPHRYFVYSKIGIDRDVLPIPEVMVQSYELSEHEILRPVFDALWQSGGFERSLSYDDNGKWSR
ncbi:MAG TPA: ATP-binding protein [Candidatus Angelobacter sp.]|nr:ATP-binding protein [Candidatus Angelobacter sp.]